MRKTVQKVYPITTLILLFFLFSFTGWVWEVICHLVEDRMFINRGVLFGPWSSHLRYGWDFNSCAFETLF